jgi:virginiamycin B lyase
MLLPAFQIPTQNCQPWGITLTSPVNSDGDVWFTEKSANQIGSVSINGVFHEYPVMTPSSAPEGIAAGPDGNVWFTESSLSVSQIGRIIAKPGPGYGTINEYAIQAYAVQKTPNSAPWEITAGPDGYLWFTEGVANKIGRISPNIAQPGDIKDFDIPTPSSAPWGVAAGPDGRIWFTEYNGNQIGVTSTAVA